MQSGRDAIHAANAEVIAKLYQSFLQNPQSVEPAWQSFFQDLDDDARGLVAHRHAR